MTDLLVPLSPLLQDLANDPAATEYLRKLVEDRDFCNRAVLLRTPQTVMTILMRVCLLALDPR